jgi:hypothetical protein
MRTCVTLAVRELPNCRVFLDEVSSFQRRANALMKKYFPLVAGSFTVLSRPAGMELIMVRTWQPRRALCSQIFATRPRHPRGKLN